LRVEGTTRDRGGAPRWQEINSSLAVAAHTTAGSANALGFRQGIARHFRGAEIMKATQLLHNLGQSIWLDNTTRDLLTSDTLEHYIDDLSVTGLTSNPTIFDHAIKNSSAYDDAIRKGLAQGKSSEEIFFDLTLEDLTQAADLFWPIFDRTNGVDGWVSLEVSPSLATTR